ncbi:HU domain-containing protein [Dyadobacter aurulentus]|uniref:HU domain-containing protein n=1 Tax=Dyadobacter sp. UC 10 TaxID=2605428 RepID=UPI0011F2D8A1|nr:SPOR domain-containing protein [Dyadobacter sp. UC 10]KAA0993235.1 SPOR domain-containing protein [Dyadobacter sp. UC 10]
MIAVETVLRKLISEYEFVIIPGFGALISHHIPATYDKGSGLFSPPAKKLAFNEYLKLDDGLLANYISRQEKWTHSEAVDYVKNYTDRLKLTLESSGQASVAGIGEFGKNVEGKLVFEPKTEKYFKDEWYGFEKIKVKHFNKAFEPKVASEQYTVDEEVEVLEFGDDKIRSFNWVRWATAAVITGLLCGLSFFMVNSENRDIQSTLNPFTELFSKPEKPTEAPAEEIKASAETPVPVMTDSVAEKAVVIDSVRVDIPVTPAAPVIKPVARFYVVAGAFKGPKHAKVLLEDLKAKGFENAVIIPGDKYSTKVKVATSVFETEKEAYRASSKLKSVIGQPGWVFKGRKSNI